MKCQITVSVSPLTGFYSPAGVFTIAGIHAMPVYLYFWEKHPPWSFVDRIQVLLLIPVIILGVGRLLGLLVEVRG